MIHALNIKVAELSKVGPVLPAILMIARLKKGR